MDRVQHAWRLPQWAGWERHTIVLNVHHNPVESSGPKRTDSPCSPPIAHTPFDQAHFAGGGAESQSGEECPGSAHCDDILSTLSPTLSDGDPGSTESWALSRNLPLPGLP